MARTLAAEGWAVTGVDLGETITEAFAALPGSGHRAVIGDATSPDVLFEALDQPPDTPLKCFVANAGITAPGESTSYPLESWDRLHDLMLRGSFLGARGRPRMPTGGSIVLVSSINGTLGFGGRAAYAAAKAVSKASYAPSPSNGPAPTSGSTASHREWPPPNFSRHSCRPATPTKQSSPARPDEQVRTTRGSRPRRGIPGF